MFNQFQSCHEKNKILIVIQFVMLRAHSHLKSVSRYRKFYFNTYYILNFNILYSARRSEHVSPLLQELHWLRVSEQIDFRLAILVYRCINSTAPRYLTSELQRVVDIESHGCLRSSSTALLHVSRSLRKTIGDLAFLLPLRESGTCYHRRSRHCHHCRLSSVH